MKNIVFIATSLDGYIADNEGNIDWLHTIPNPKNDDLGYNAMINEVDALVMGRKTFETVKNFDIDWPYRKHVFVISNSMKEIPDGYENKISIVSGHIVSILKSIRSKGFNNLYIDGGSTIQNFIAEGLIDEITITTIPILLGGGISLFGSTSDRQSFELVDSKVYLNQLVQSKYRKIKAN